MYVRCRLAEIARKGVMETANVGRKFSGVGLLFCGAAKVAASAMNCELWRALFYTNGVI